MSVTGRVFNIQRFSLHDGPGIRTTVFLKGCPLRCVWCHNPEGLSSAPQVRLTASLCTRCGSCVTVCEHGGHVVSPDNHILHPTECTHCGKCVAACPFGALEMVGETMTAEEVMSVVRRDAPFYKQSGGGVTLSGGEPLAQESFSRAILDLARTDGVHTAVETSAYCTWQELLLFRPLVDLFLVDLKHTDDKRHREVTGVSNARIISNIARMSNAGWPLILRVPWVPGVTAEPLFLDGLLAFLSTLAVSPPVELMLYHRLGAGKRTALGMPAGMPDDILGATGDDALPWIEQLMSAGYHASTS